MRLPMLPRYFPLWPGIEALWRDSRIEAEPRLGQDARQLLAFSRVVAGRLGSRPARNHCLKWLLREVGTGLKEPIEPQQPVSLRFILISPAAHQHDMVLHEVTQHAAEGRRPS